MSKERIFCESRIDGEYNGWEGDTVYRLINGQTWQQASYRYFYRYEYMPLVKVIDINGRYTMFVGSESVGQHVRRIY